MSNFAEKAKAFKEKFARYEVEMRALEKEFKEKGESLELSKKVEDKIVEMTNELNIVDFSKIMR